eukprot:s78_g43.t1
MDYLKRDSFMNLGGGNEQRCLELLESKVSSPAVKLLANRLREQGNAAFQQKDFFDAARAYTESLEAYGLDARVYANRAAVWLELAKLTTDNLEKQFMFQKTCTDCQRCITLDSKNVKAFFRLALASMGLKDFPQALRIVCDALKSCKGVSGIQSLQKLRDELRARAVPHFEGIRNPLQTASRNALQAVAQGAPYKPCSWCWKPALLDMDCPHCPHCGCDPFSAGPGALPGDYGVEWEDVEVPGQEGETVDEAVDAGIEASIREADAQAAAANAPLSAAILESRCSPTVYLLEFSRSPSSFLEALLNHPALQACADGLAAKVTDVWAEAGPPLLKSGAKMFVNPEQVPLVLEQIRAEGWQLKPRHVIVNDQYEEAVVEAVSGIRSRDRVVQKRCSEIGAFGASISGQAGGSSDPGEKPEEASQSEWLSVVKRTFIHLPIPSSMWSGPSSGQKTASTSQAHVAENPRQRKRPLVDPSSDCED